jgi:hypothetical protein
MRRTRRHPPWIMFANNPQIHERQILDISECPKLVADVEPPIGASFRLSAVAQGVVGRRREVVRCKGRTIGIRIAAATSKTEWPHAFPIELLSNNRRQGLRYATSICCSPRRPLGVRANAEEPLPG